MDNVITDTNANTNVKKRKSRKILSLLFLTGLSSVILIVGTYAWFVGTSVAKVESFELGISTGDELLLSLDGKTWNKDLSFDSSKIETAYTGNTNHLPGGNGLIPISTNGEVDETVGRLKLFGKSSITASAGGFRLISTRIDNYQTTGSGQISGEQHGYLAFDLFVKNGTGSTYIKEYDKTSEEAIYLITSSAVVANQNGGSVPDYGLANSVRVAFMQVGRVAATVTDQETINAINCTTDTNNTGLCLNEKTVIWEPNDTKHETSLITYYETVCKSRNMDGSYGTSPCSKVVDGTYTNTFVVNQNIVSSDRVDIYDGLNGFTVGSNYKLNKSMAFTDTLKMVADADRQEIFTLAPNSITKIRVYIYLEGQDVDNYDLVSLNKKINITFGFTKDKYNLGG